MSSRYFLCKIVEIAFRKAIREQDDHVVRDIMIAVWNDWPDNNEFTFGVGEQKLSVAPKDELLLQAKSFLEGKGYVVDFDDKHGIKIMAADAGFCWSANSPTSII